MADKNFKVGDIEIGDDLIIDGNLPNTAGGVLILDSDGKLPAVDGSNLVLSLPIEPGEQVYTTPGTYSWVCPDGVTSVCVVAVGGGGTSYDGGGGGAALSFVNDVTVVPGNSYSVTVGAKADYDQYGNDGENSSFASDCVAGGGKGRDTVQFTDKAGVGGQVITGSGGSGGAGGEANGFGRGGGGGAGGYTGVGGVGGSPLSTGNGTDGQGGGGGGGGRSHSSYGGGAGGGVGLYGQGSNGSGATGNSSGTGPSGTAGSGGSGANYGGGGGGGSANMGNGAVRIMWGDGRSFPSNAS